MKCDEFVKMNEQGAGHWWYKARRELLSGQIERLPRGLKNLKILDLASACGDNFSACSGYGEAYGIYISLQSVRYCKEKNIKTIVQGDAQTLPFKSGSYDIVLALDVFEHLKDDVACLKEITRVLKKGGRLIFNTPACKSLYSYHDRAFEHVRRYGAGELRKKAALAELKIVFMTHWSFFIFPAIYVVRKFFSRSGKNGEKILSDFYREINPALEKFLSILLKIETISIKKNITFPFGVSLFGVAQKNLS